MKKLQIPLLALFIIFGTAIQAQSWLNITYDFGHFASKGMPKFIKKSSWAGVQSEFQYIFSNRMSVGFLSGYQGYYEKRARSTFNFGNESVNAVTWRYYKSIPVLATYKYYFLDGLASPYIGVGIGGDVCRQEVQFGQYLLTNKRFAFSFLGEAGLFLNFRDYWGLIFNVKYKYSAFNPKDFDNTKVGMIHVGAGFMFRL